MRIHIKGFKFPCICFDIESQSLHNQFAISNSKKTTSCVESDSFNVTSSGESDSFNVTIEC